MNLLYFPIIVSVFAMMFVWSFVVKKNKGQAVSQAQESIWTRKNKTIAIFAIVLFILSFILGWKIAFGFLIGVSLSALILFLDPAKLLAMSFGLFAVSFCYLVTGDIFSLLSLGFGACFIPLFTSKGSVFGAYSVSVIGTMILGLLLFPKSPQFVLLPLVLASVSVLVAIISSFFAKNRVAYALILMAGTFYLIIARLMEGKAISVLNLYLSAVIGFTAALAITFVASKKYSVILQPLLLFAGVALSFWLASFYGIALLAIGVVLLSAITPENNHNIISSVMASLVLFLAYFIQVWPHGINLSLATDLRIISGILIGAVIPLAFILPSTLKIASRRFFPFFVSILAPVLTGLILGPQALAGLVLGAIIAGFFIGISGKSIPAINPIIQFLPLTSLLALAFLI